jgi:hypothetical protein
MTRQTALMVHVFCVWVVRRENFFTLVTCCTVALFGIGDLFWCSERAGAQTNKQKKKDEKHNKGAYNLAC